MAVQVGESLGRYQLEGLVGQGGMAVVYRAVDRVLGRTVAVKVIRPAYTEDPHFIERFLQEARLVASLDHPNILPLYDFGEERGTPYLVQPYLPGGSLADRMSALPQPLTLVAAWLLQLAGALDTAHARGVLHRDVKSGNVLITKDGRLMLGDFGIARLAEATTRLTATGMVVGTPIYMAPELARGADASPASDRYALAVLAYEMIGGLPPFLGSNPLSVLHQQVHEPVPALAAKVPGLQPGVDAFLARALAKAPERRHPTCRAMAEHLVELLTPEQRSELSTMVWSGTPDSSAWSAPEALTMVERGRTVKMPGPTVPTVMRPSPSPTSAVTAEAPRPPRRSPLVWGLLAVAAVAGAVLLVPRELLTGSQRAVTDRAEPAPPAPLAGGSPATPPQAAPPGTSTAEASTAPGPAAGTGPVTTSPVTGGARLPLPEDARDGAAAAAIEAETPFEPPALGPGPQGRRDLLELMRRPTHRLDAAEFERLVAAASAAETAGAGMRERLKPLRTWAQGGLAYAQGKTAEASALRSQLSPESSPWGIGWPAAVFTTGSPWDLPAIFADPRNELDATLQPALEGLGSNPRAALAAAYSAHLDGNHKGALRLLDEAGVDPSSGAAPANARAVMAQLFVAEAVEARDTTAARKWLPYALEGGRAPLARPFLAEMQVLARENLGAAAALELRNEACRMGVAGLCGAAVVRPADKPQQRPLRPDRFPGRRRRVPIGGGGGGGGGLPGAGSGAAR
jgi:serine/threonine-protein kinase